VPSGAVIEVGVCAILQGKITCQLDEKHIFVTEKAVIWFMLLQLLRRSQSVIYATDEPMRGKDTGWPDKGRHSRLFKIHLWQMGRG